MIVTCLILGGCIGLLAIGFRCAEGRTHNMTFAEWEYKHNNKPSPHDPNGLDNWYRYLQEGIMLRPQILLSIIILGVVSVYSLELGSIEITTGCITLLGALGMKILESDK